MPCLGAIFWRSVAAISMKDGFVMSDICPQIPSFYEISWIICVNMEYVCNWLLAVVLVDIWRDTLKLTNG